MGHESDERQRLQALYAGMTEEELLRLASEEDELTDVASEALEDELERRGLEAEAPPPRERKQVDGRKLAVVAQFRDLPEALLAKGMLESSGIECVLGDENIVRMDWFISNFVGGVKLRVSAEDEYEALRLLAQPTPERFSLGPDEEFEQPECPRCHSHEVSYEELHKPIAYTSAWIGIPLPVRRDEWKCNACGARWKEDFG